LNLTETEYKGVPEFAQPVYFRAFVFGDCTFLQLNEARFEISLKFLQLAHVIGVAKSERFPGVFLYEVEIPQSLQRRLSIAEVGLLQRLMNSLHASDSEDLINGQPHQDYDEQAVSEDDSCCNLHSSPGSQRGRILRSQWLRPDSDATTIFAVFQPIP